MSTGLILVAVIVGAYLAAHVLFDWLGRRYLIVSGAEYLLLGILMGPAVSGLLNTGVVGQFAPFMTLALGWIGALIGAQFRVRELLRIEGVHYRIAFIEAFMTVAVTAGAGAALLVYILRASWHDAIIAGIALGAIAVAAAPSGIAMATRDLRRRGPIVQQLEVTTAVDALVAIIVFGILIAVVHGAPPGAVTRPPTGTEWSVITLGIGFVGGALFHLFLGEEKDPDRLFIALAGALVLTSGAAAYLRLSPLIVTMIIGMVLVNTSRNTSAIATVLTRVERPLYYVLLLFVGAAWRPVDNLLWVAPIALFLLIRMAVKIGSARLAARSQGTLPQLGSDWGRALVGQGGLAIAIAFNYQLLDHLPYRSIIFTTAIASMLLTDINSPRLVQAVLGPQLRRIGIGTGAPAETSQ